MRILAEFSPPSELKTLNETLLQTYHNHILQVGVVDDKGVEVRADQMFVSADMFDVDMVLGMPWVDQVDPVIRWHKRKLFHIRSSGNEDGQACLHEVYDLETGEPVVERTQVRRSNTFDSHSDIAVVDTQGIRRLCAEEGIQAFLLNDQDLDQTV